MLYTTVLLAAATALLGAHGAAAFFWWPWRSGAPNPFAFTGCIRGGNTWLSLYTIDAPTAEQCVTQCGPLADMAYYRPETDDCKCGTSPKFSLASIFRVSPYVAGNPGECGRDWESYVSTPYSFLGCANNLDPANAVSSHSGFVLSSPFRRCDPATQIMAFKFDARFLFRWTSYCFSPQSPPMVGDMDPKQCNGGTWYLYGSPQA